jgi:predicted TIM-barrel fold metal-dependent hydrolase
LIPTPLPDEAEQVRGENDWAIAQVSRHPDRLVAFCGTNPLKQHAIDELKRCAKLPAVKGMKLHFANSRIDLKNVEHVQRVRAFFAAANAARMPIAAHLWSGPGYGREHSEIFVKEILPAAPEITIQIMHLAGAGPSYGPDAALAVYAEAAGAGNPAMKNVYFDTAAVSGREPAEVLELIAKRLRAIGLKRILFATDFDGLRGLAPAEGWKAFRKLPLTEQEFETIAANVAPYLR